MLKKTNIKKGDSARWGMVGQNTGDKGTCTCQMSLWKRCGPPSQVLLLDIVLWAEVRLTLSETLLLLKSSRSRLLQASSEPWLLHPSEELQPP